MKVKNMKSDKGNSVPNQFIIYSDEGVFFQSYNSIICKRTYNPEGFNKVFLDSYYWDYSKTTSKYRNQVLRETTKETQAKINSGEYILTELNYD